MDGRLFARTHVSVIKTCLKLSIGRLNLEVSSIIASTFDVASAVSEIFDLIRNFVHYAVNFIQRAILANTEWKICLKMSFPVELIADSGKQTFKNRPTSPFRWPAHSKDIWTCRVLADVYIRRRSAISSELRSCLAVLYSLGVWWTSADTWHVTSIYYVLHLVFFF